MNFSEADFRLVAESLLGLHQHKERETIWQAMIQALDRIVPSMAVAYNEVDHLENRIRIHHNHSSPGEVEKLTPAVHLFAHEHPVNNFQMATNCKSAMAISDFLTQRQFKRLGLYNEWYKPLGVNHQMSLYLPSPSHLQIALTLQRDKTAFSEKDRFLLNQLAPHLALAYENTTTRQPGLKINRRTPEVRRFTGSIFLNSAGEVIADRYSVLTRINSAFGIRRRAVPPAIADWFKLQTSQPLSIQPNSKLIIRQEKSVWTFRLRPDSEDSFEVLVECKTTDPITAIEQMGLTTREAEVLYWIAAAKTNLEIAAITGARVRTIDKHVERILQKLGVENRQAAALTLIRGEWLRSHEEPSETGL